MRRMGGVFWALMVLPLLASAAEVTRVASSAEENHPFGMFVDVWYERIQHNGVLTRQVHEGGGISDQPELNYVGVDSRLEVAAHVGIWRNLEVNFALPIVFSQTDEYTFASGRDATNSTLVQNCLAATGDLLDPNCLATGAGAQPVGTIPSVMYRGGLGNLRFGMKYGILKQKLDGSKPDWVVYLIYEAPTASRYDPAAVTSFKTRTGVGDKVHRYTFGTALSRRMGLADPYFKFDYTLPFRGPGWYSNCDRTDLGNLGAPENCGNGFWSRSDTGLNAPHVFRMKFGTEIVPLDNPARGQRVSIDIQGLATYYTGGRYFTEVTPLFQKLMSSDGYLEVGGSIAVVAQPASYVTFRLRGSYAYQTDRVVTNEPLGKDLDGDGRISFIRPDAPELNPAFDQRVDAVGRKMRLVDNGIWSINASVSFNF